ncbi:probable calcium-binding protein CML45 [Impatiens glandulifera]|uniref:probable calcium-binding protein CML45 n=1 Tax=Impatiens glandulifera TaxID=253017 RepID=UPI001FB04F04|nr:probable calcium-binding protein CML45 [Impatiens glandulifera]
MHHLTTIQLYYLEMFFLSKILMLLQITTKHITIISHDLILYYLLSAPILSDPVPNQSDDNIKESDKKISGGELVTVMNKLGMPCEDDQPYEGWFGSEELSGLFEEDGPSFDELKETFDVFDENKDGFIDVRELRRVLIRLGFEEESSTELRCERMIRGCDENGDGLVDLREFVKLMEKCFL